MRKIKYLCNLIIIFSMFLIFSKTIYADTDWVLEGQATTQNSECVLIPNSLQAEGALIKTIPIDTREGFFISFEYYSGDYITRKRIGSRFIMANEPVILGDAIDYGYWEYIYTSKSDLVFYGVQFSNSGSISTITKSNKDYRVIDFYDTTVCDGQWHKVALKYENQTLTLYWDDEQIIESKDIYMPEKTYLGFTSGNSYYGCAKHAVRNISLQATEYKLVKFDANQGTCNINDMYILNKTNVQLPNATREGYIFKGWYTKKKGGVKVNPATYEFSQWQTLYAQWKNNQKTLKFKANKGTVKIKNKKVTTGNKAGKMPKAKRKYYAFKGWYTKRNGGKKITKNTIIKKNMKLYAHWQKKKIVKFVSRGKVVKTKYVKRNGKIGDLTSPSRKGFSFKGWYTKKKGGKRISADTKIKKNVTYYAQWERINSTPSRGGSSSDDWWDDSSRRNNNDRCIICGNDGEVDCGTCGGSGGKYEYTSTPNYSGSLYGSTSSRRWVDCWRCHGSGEMDCYYCDN